MFITETEAELTDIDTPAFEFMQQVEVPTGSLLYQFEKSGTVTSIYFDSPLIQYPFTMKVGSRQELPSGLSRVPMSIFQFLDEKSPTAKEWPLATFVCHNYGPNIFCKMGTTQIPVQVSPQIMGKESRHELSKFLTARTPNLQMLFYDINIRLRIMSGIGKY